MQKTREFESMAKKKNDKDQLLLGTEEAKSENKEDNEPFIRALTEMSELMDVPMREVKDGCCLFQIRELMKKMGKVLVRYNVSDAELQKLLENARELSLGEVTVSPTYLHSCRKAVKKRKLNDSVVHEIVDFPFGESTFRGKMSEVKSGIAYGVDGITVMYSDRMLEKEHVKEFKKELKKLARIRKTEIGVAFSAMELNEEQIKTGMKTAEKYAISFVTFAFGDVDEKTLREKMGFVNKYKSKLPVKILANVSTATAVTELFKLGVDTILTPFADDIGKELVERFDVKNVKLL